MYVCTQFLHRQEHYSFKVIVKSATTLREHVMLQLGEIAKQLLRVSDVGSIKDAYHTLEGIAALTGSGNLQIPALLSLKSAAVPVKEVRLLLSHAPCSLVLQLCSLGTLAMRLCNKIHRSVRCGVTLYGQGTQFSFEDQKMCQS